MKLDPIKPAPPVTSIVFSISVELASNSIAPTARRTLARAQTFNCKQKGRDSPRPLGAFGFMQTAAFPDGLRRLSYAAARGAVGAGTATRRIGLWVGVSANSQPIISKCTGRPARQSSTPDNVRGCCVSQSVARPHPRLDSQSAIAGDPPSLPRYRAGNWIFDRPQRPIFRNVVAADAKAQHASHPQQFENLPPRLYKSGDGPPCLTTIPTPAPLPSRAARLSSPPDCCSPLLRWWCSIPAVERS